jgi:hypothetical protein
MRGVPRGQLHAIDFYVAPGDVQISAARRRNWISNLVAALEDARIDRSILAYRDRALPSIHLTVRGLGPPVSLSGKPDGPVFVWEHRQLAAFESPSIGKV